MSIEERSGLANRQKQTKRLARCYKQRLPGPKTERQKLIMAGTFPDRPIGSQKIKVKEFWHDSKVELVNALRSDWRYLTKPRSLRLGNRAQKAGFTCCSAMTPDEQTKAQMRTTELVTLERQAHHNALATLSADPKADGLKLWRKLRRIEQRAHKLAEDYCNGDCTSEQWDAAKAEFYSEVAVVFGRLPRGFFVNGDPRGYTLKLDPDDCTVPAGMHTDWGRYGILAPEIN